MDSGIQDSDAQIRSLWLSNSSLGRAQTMALCPTLLSLNVPHTEFVPFLNLC